MNGFLAFMRVEGRLSSPLSEIVIFWVLMLLQEAGLFLA